MLGMLGGRTALLDGTNTEGRAGKYPPSAGTDPGGGRPVQGRAGREQVDHGGGQVDGGDAAVAQGGPRVRVRHRGARTLVGDQVDHAVGAAGAVVNPAQLGYPPGDRIVEREPAPVPKPKVAGEVYVLPKHLDRERRWIGHPRDRYLDKAIGRTGAPYSANLTAAGLTDVRVVPVRNEFFGGNIAVTGLLTGPDLARVLADEPDEVQSNYRGTDYIGKLGLEQSYERELHGITGFEQVEIDAAYAGYLDRQTADAEALRRDEALRRTTAHRPDLIERCDPKVFDKKDREMLSILGWMPDPAGEPYGRFWRRPEGMEQ